MSIAEAVLDIEIPDDKMGKIIKSGGYETFDEMINDISPKLEKVFLEGGFEEKEKVNQE